MVSLLLHVMMNVIILLCVLALCLGMPPPPPHSCGHRVLHSDGDKKVFITLNNIGPYSFKQRREKGSRVTFTCNGCRKFKHYLPVVAVREQVDSDPEHAQYDDCPRGLGPQVW